MRKGIFRIIAGCLLILAQILSIIGNAQSGNASLSFSSTSAALFLFESLYAIAYFSPAICGVLLLVFGIRAFASYETAQQILHTTAKPLHTVVKYVFAGLQVLGITALIYGIFAGSTVSVSLIPMGISLICMAIYLLCYHGRRPTVLMSTALLFLSFATVLSFDNFDMAIAKNDLTGFAEGLSAIVSGILYLILAVKLYRERFSVNSVKWFGCIAMVLDVVRIVVFPIVTDVDLFFRSFLYSILFALFFLIEPLTMFVYTVLFPPCCTAPAATTDGKKCRNCSFTLEEGSEFCRYCGTPVTATDDDAQEVLPVSDAALQTESDTASDQPSDSAKHSSASSRSKTPIAVTVMRTLTALMLTAMVLLSVWQYRQNVLLQETIEKQTLTVETLQTKLKEQDDAADDAMENAQATLQEKIDLLTDSLSERDADIASLQSKIADTEEHIASVKADLEAGIRNYAALEAQHLQYVNDSLDEYEKAQFVDWYVRLVPDREWVLYCHKYDCPMVDMEESFFITDLYTAAERGYRSCSVCGS